MVQRRDIRCPVASAFTTYQAIENRKLAHLKKRDQKKKRESMSLQKSQIAEAEKKKEKMSNIPKGEKMKTLVINEQKTKKGVLPPKKLNLSNINKKVVNGNCNEFHEDTVRCKKIASSASKTKNARKKFKTAKIHKNRQKANDDENVTNVDKAIETKANKNKIKKRAIKKSLGGKRWDEISQNNTDNLCDEVSQSTSSDVKGVCDEVSQSTLSEVKGNKRKRKQVESKVQKKKKFKLVKNLKKKKTTKEVEGHELDKVAMTDSQKLGWKAFEWMINPISSVDFFRNYWEKSELLIKSTSEKKFAGILSCADIDKILRRNILEYTKNIDVTSYKGGKRETHNPEGRALASLIWDFYNSGCSIRLLNPQTFHRPIWKLLATLQGYFKSFCGANVYLTPPGTQGFAPHWDDIEAFILQLEGKKRWRVYKPRTPEETLPRGSSKNFGPDDVLGDPVLDCVLEPGDLLYFPRGFIHQGEALNDTHSLHITISTYQKNAWVDLLEKLLPAALAAAAEEDVEFRKGVPLECFNHLGIAYADKVTNVQKELAQKVSDLVVKMIDYAPIHGAADQMAKGFIHDSLPPVLSEGEQKCSVFDGGEKWSEKENGVVNHVELLPESSIRLIRKDCVRLVVEDDSVRLFYSVENSREYHAEEPKFLEVEPSIAPAIEGLIHTYPHYTPIEHLPLSTLDEKMSLAISLWEKGIVETDAQL